MQIFNNSSPVEVLAALSNAVRLEIVRLLIDTERCVSDIASHFHLDLSVISRHLRILEQAGIISFCRVGKNVIYRLADQRVKLIIKILSNAGINTRHRRGGSRLIGNETR
jgi:DNA-binding transcriptional ArsR family regulator